MIDLYLVRTQSDDLWFDDSIYFTREKAASRIKYLLPKFGDNNIILIELSATENHSYTAKQLKGTLWFDVARAYECGCKK